MLPGLSSRMTDAAVAVGPFTEKGLEKSDAKSVREGPHNDRIGQLPAPLASCDHPRLGAALPRFVLRQPSVVSR